MICLMYSFFRRYPLWSLLNTVLRNVRRYRGVFVEKKTSPRTASNKAAIVLDPILDLTLYSICFSRPGKYCWNNSLFCHDVNIISDSLANIKRRVSSVLSLSAVKNCPRFGLLTPSLFMRLVTSYNSSPSHVSLCKILISHVIVIFWKKNVIIQAISLYG